MNTQQNLSTDSVGGDNDRGFTLVEILIAIVLVGILSVVVIVGISNLTSTGSKSACTASADSAKAGSVAYYAGHGVYADTFTKLTAPTAPESPALTLPTDATVDSTGLKVMPKNKDWTLTMTVVSGAAPTFACS